MTDYERVGGETGLEELVSAYVDRFFEDFIIGYLFEGKDRDRIKRFEAQLAGAHLGAKGRYEGRPLGESHKPLKINVGHFRRRLAILRQVLRERAVPEAVIDRWIAFEQALESTVTDGTDCVA